MNLKGLFVLDLGPYCMHVNILQNVAILSQFFDVLIRLLNPHISDSLALINASHLCHDHKCKILKTKY